MGEGLGRWKVAAYGVSLGIDFANLDWQKTARSSLSGRGRNGRLTNHLNGEQHTGTIRGLRFLAKYKAPDSANIIIYHTE